MNRKTRMLMYRILGNGGLAFFTVLGSLNFAGINTHQAFLAAIFGAFVQGGLASMLELKKFTDGYLEDLEEDIKKGKKPPLRSYLLVF